LRRPKPRSSLVAVTSTNGAADRGTRSRLKYALPESCRSPPRGGSRRSAAVRLPCGYEALGNDDRPAAGGHPGMICGVIDESLSERALSQKDIELLRSDLYELTPTVFETSLPAQPLHGDASLSNLLRTADGLIWNDLEDVCTGPVAWDLAGFIASLRADGQDQTFIDRVIVAYGAVGLEGLGPFFDAHELYLTIWQSLVAQRRPGAPASVPERITRWRDHVRR
jgi:hypothetical protein